MDGVEDSAMIALLPVVANWSKLELPHLTLVYAGLVADNPPTTYQAMAKDAAALAMTNRPITLKTMGVEVFGDAEKVDVLRLRNTPQLVAMRRLVEDWNRSEWAFNPHVTIGPAGSGSLTPGEYPGYVAFDRICVCYGGDMMT